MRAFPHEFEAGEKMTEDRPQMASEQKGFLARLSRGLIEGGRWKAVLVLLGMLTCGVYLFFRYNSKYTLVVTALVLGVLAAVLFCQRLDKGEGARHDFAFIVGLALSGLVFTFVFAPGTVPDEIYHFNSSYKYSDMILMQEVSNTSITMRACDAEFEDAVLYHYHSDPSLTAPTVNRSLYRTVVQSFALFAGDAELVQVPVDSSYAVEANLPQLKLPSALGIVLARIIGLGSVPLFYLGRLFNFAFFVILVVAAVKITPIGRNIFKVVSLLPMTLHVASSYSYDAGTIGLAFLFCALALKAMCLERKLDKRELAALAVAAVLMAPCKVIYSFLLVILMLLPSDRFATPKSGRLYKFGVIGGIIAFVALLRIDTFAAMFVNTTSQTVSEVSSSSSPAYYSFTDLVTDPLGTVALLARTTDAYADFYMLSMVGAQLGWFQSTLFAPYYAALPLFFILALSSVRSPEDKEILPRAPRAAFFGAFAVFYIALLVEFAIAWTTDGSFLIEGVQGRYFLPMLPLLLLALRGRTVTLSRSIMPVLELSEIFIGLFIVLRAFAIALTL
ncbi:hypothetical protein B5F73_03830 [Olsenella sp. An270]|nr:hypothetical protein B5F73_03830 [Olsenella sp. An270]